MLLLTSILAAIYGLVLGSFANVLILRDKSRRTIVTGHSECPHCQRMLRWYELIPVLSFLIQGGKCRGCSEAISWQYPLVEISSAILTFLLAVIFADWPIISLALIAISALLALVYSVIDIRTQEVPIDYVVVSGLLAALAHFIAGDNFSSIFFGVLVGAGVIQCIRLAWWAFRKEEGMGSGDAWIAGALGAFVGYPNILVLLFLSVIIGALVGIAIIASSPKKKVAARAMPFGPFLFTAAILTLIWGEPLLRWYTGYLGYMY